MEAFVDSTKRDLCTKQILKKLTFIRSFVDVNI